MGAIHRFTGTDSAFDWDGVEPERYEESGTAGATRRILIGPDDGARNFVMRYFEIPPGGRSSLDRHGHDHGVYILKGKARLTLEGAAHDLGPGDVAHIAPNEVHQLENIGGDPLGFLCVIPPISQE